MDETPRSFRYFLPLGWLAVALVTLALWTQSHEAHSSLRALSGKGMRNPASAEGMLLVYKFSAKKVEFLQFPENSLLISKDCQKTAGKLSCAAWEAMNRVGSFQLPAAADPARQASQLCQLTGGKLEQGQDEHSNEVAFCAYDDGSRVGMSALLAATQR